MRRAVKINIIRDEGAALAAGLQPEDILLSIDGIPIQSAENLKIARALASTETKAIFIRREQVFFTSLPAGEMGISFSIIDIDDIAETSAQPLQQRQSPTSEICDAAIINQVIVTTAPSVEGSRITQQLGIISAECVFGMNIFKDFFASMTDIFGGRSKTTQNVLRDARETCIAELKREAASRGANAVIAVDLDYSEFSGQGKSMLFLVASGTAVVIEKT